MSKFGTKNAIFGYFWARILKNYYNILKSALSGPGSAFSEDPGPGPLYKVCLNFLMIAWGNFCEV